MNNVYLLVSAYVFLFLVFLLVAKKIADGLTRFDDDRAIQEEGNMAIALRRFGLFLGLGIAMAGVMGGGLSKLDMTIFIIDGGIAIVLFFCAHYVNEYLIVPGISNNDLIKEGNIPTGLVEAGSFLATGILLNGAFAGEEGPLLSAVVFFLLGQSFLVLAVKIHQKVYRFNVAACLRDRNISAGVTVAGLLISYSFILRATIAGSFTGWAESLGYFLASALTGIIGLLICERLAGFIFLAKIRIADEINRANTAAAILVQGITITLALIISRLI
jgi:uncharacterized membrane protein YjfL (UPF0719 family)